MHNFLSKREVPKNDMFLFQFFGTIGLFQCYLNDIGMIKPIIAENSGNFKELEKNIYSWICQTGREFTREFLKRYNEMLMRERDKSRYRHKSTRQTTVKTVYGEVTYRRTVYGYMVDPADRKKWIVDEEAAAVVKRVFDLCIAGEGPSQIANILKADNVLIAKAHYAKKKGKALPENAYNWEDSTIVGILERMDYCGHTVNFKSYSKSHKLKKRIPTTKEQ